MERFDRHPGLAAVDPCEAVYIAGGIDKGAQDALYMIGFALGYIVKTATKIYLFFKSIF